jgi:hypothetical protein
VGVRKTSDGSHAQWREPGNGEYSWTPPIPAPHVIGANEISPSCSAEAIKSRIPRVPARRFAWAAATPLTLALAGLFNGGRHRIGTMGAITPESAAKPQIRAKNLRHETVHYETVGQDDRSRPARCSRSHIGRIRHQTITRLPHLTSDKLARPNAHFVRCHSENEAAAPFSSGGTLSRRLVLQKLHSWPATLHGRRCGPEA